MTAAELAKILTRARRENRGPAGESDLDALVRRARLTPRFYEEVVRDLTEAAKLLASAEEWQALQIVISQLSIHSPAIGEALDHHLKEASLPDAAFLWAMRCVFDLGATPTDQLFDRLLSKEVASTNPREWLALIAALAPASVTEEEFLELAKSGCLNAQSACDVIRTYKRLSISLRIPFFARVGQFMLALAPPVRAEVARKLAAVLGPGFRDYQGPDRTGAPSDNFPELFAGLARMAANTIESRRVAMA